MEYRAEPKGRPTADIFSAAPNPTSHGGPPFFLRSSSYQSAGAASQSEDPPDQKQPRRSEQHPFRFHLQPDQPLRTPPLTGGGKIASGGDLLRKVSSVLRRQTSSNASGDVRAQQRVGGVTGQFNQIRNGGVMDSSAVMAVPLNAGLARQSSQSNGEAVIYQPMGHSGQQFNQTGQPAEIVDPRMRPHMGQESPSFGVARDALDYDYFSANPAIREVHPDRGQGVKEYQPAGGVPALAPAASRIFAPKKTELPRTNFPGAFIPTAHPFFSAAAAADQQKENNPYYAGPQYAGVNRGRGTGQGDVTREIPMRNNDVANDDVESSIISSGSDASGIRGVNDSGWHGGMNGAGVGAMVRQERRNFGLVSESRDSPTGVSNLPLYI